MCVSVFVTVFECAKVYPAPPDIPASAAKAFTDADTPRDIPIPPVRPPDDPDVSVTFGEAELTSS